jgi:hypothetical protein
MVWIQQYFPYWAECWIEWAAEVNSVRRSSPWDQKKRLKLDWTGLIRIGPVVYLWTSLFWFSCQLPSFKNIIGPMKNWFKSVETGLSWKPLLEHVPTLISINSHPWTIKSGQELVKIWQKSFLHKYFVVIRMTLITLLITCAINFFGTPEYYPRHINHTLNHVYDVCFIFSTPLTSYNNFQTTDTIGWVPAMSFHSGHKMVKSWPNLLKVRPNYG